MDPGRACSGGHTGAAGEIMVRDVVRDVVVELAPEELPLVQGLAGFDDAVAVRRLGRRGRREPLGFGLGEIATLVTPVVWLAVDQAARRIGTAAADGATKRMKALVHKVFHRRSRPVTVPPLTRDQLAEVRRLVLEVAAQRGLKQQRAVAVADAVVSKLALATPEQDTRGTPAGPNGSGGRGIPAKEQ